MQDRFEKEVQHKMEELKLTPSAPVWEKIELEIRHEKKRRRVILWFLLAGLFLSGSAWWLYQSFGNDDSQATSEDAIPSTQDPTAQKTVTQSPGQTTNTYTINEQPGSIKPKDDESRSSSNTVVAGPQKFPPEKKRIAKTYKTSVSKKNSEENFPASVKKEDKPTETISITTQPIKKQSTSATDIVDNTVPSSQSFPNDSVAIPLMEKKVVPENLAIDSSLKKKVAINHKWTKQINVILGGSSYASGLSLSNKSAAQDALASIGGGTGTSTGGIVNNNFVPAPTEDGFGFSIGFSMSKKLNEHWEAAFGLQYTQLTTKTKVGDKRRIDTAVLFSTDRLNVDEFYTNTGKNDYTNRFHILEVPVTISYRPAIKLPLYISTGISYGRLISSNALTFSNTANIYYENDENYVRNLLPVQASVQYRFGDKKTLNIQTGPVIQYNLLKFQKESTDEKTHLLFAGLKTTVNF